MGVSGLDFSPDGQFLYFIRTTPLGHTAMRMEVPALSTPQTILQGATEVRRTIHGHMLLTKQQDVYTVTDPDAPVLLDAVNSTAVIWSCPDPILFPHVALQPLIIHNERPVAYRHIGRKHYELSDHLGNVRVVVSDLKLSSLDVDNEPSAFTADVVSRTDYYAYGSPMPGRNYSSQVYRSGFNGMFKDDEVGGPGSHYFARFWEYDSRVAKRWNMDPITMPSHSPYAVFNCNPIFFIDPDGDSPFKAIGKFFRGLGRVLRGKPWKCATCDRQVGKRDVQLPEGTNTSNFRGIANWFRSRKMGAPAGRMVNLGWNRGGRGLTLNATDKVDYINVYQQLIALSGGDGRVSVSGLNVWGQASGPGHINVSAINRRGRKEPIFGSSAAQLLTWPGTWFFLNPNNGVGHFEFKSSPIPMLNLLPTLELPALFGVPVLNIPTALIHNLFGLWLQNAFNGKPLWTGDITKLEVSAKLPLGGAVTYNYDFKGKGWQPYTDQPWWRKILYGY